jgi:hypothetical protein
MTWEAEFDLAVMTGHAFQCIDGLGAFLAGAWFSLVVTGPGDFYGRS